MKTPPTPPPLNKRLLPLVAAALAGLTSAGDQILTLTWTDPNATKATNYSVRFKYLGIVDIFELRGFSSATNFLTITNLSEGLYQWSVVAQGAAGSAESTNRILIVKSNSVCGASALTDYDGRDTLLVEDPEGSIQAPIGLAESFTNSP